MGQLGDTLKERRLALGIPIERAEEATKIRAKMLLALEDSDYARLPNPGYVRGYISSYARFLELDSVPLLAMYRAETGSTRFHDIAPPDEAVRPRGEQHQVPWRVGVVVVVILAVLSIVIWAALGAKHGPGKVPPIPTTPGSQSATGSVTPSGDSTSSKSPATQPRSTTHARLTPFTLKVTVASGSASWLNITIDGKQAYAGSLTGGSSKSFQVTKKAVVQVGRPSSVSVYRDGKQAAIPSTSGTSTLVLNADPAP
jgi:cytoskeletal protein RodZ